MSGWIASVPCRRADADRLADGVDGIDAAPALSTTEEDEAGDRWRLDGFWDAEPDATALAVFAALVPGAAVPVAHPIEARDWVVESQAGLEPVVAGRFVVVTDEGVEAPAGLSRLVVPATNAFGTGHHETTAGCLSMLDRLQRRGHRFARVADIGTGTGLLAFAVHRLWPRARIMASDIDPAAVRVASDLAGRNGVARGTGPGRLTLVAAAGADHPTIRANAPYDLVIANILAGPLNALMPGFAAMMAGGGTLILAGLTTGQRAGVVLRGRQCGFRLDGVPTDERWPTLRMVRRARRATQRHRRTSGTGEW